MIAPRMPAPLTLDDFPVECPSQETVSSRRRSWLNRGKSQVLFNGRSEETRNGTRLPGAEKLIACGTLERRPGGNAEAVLISSLLQE